MNKFSEMGIEKPEMKHLVGDKIKINRLLNREITVTDFRVEPSQFGDNKECLYLQLEMDGNKHVLFTGATILIHTIKQIPKERFPFKTTIIQEQEWYEFS